jgi:uncharacterized protein YjiS (DUF1127 family)
MDTMTYMTTTLRPLHLVRRLSHGLATHSRRRATAAHLDRLTDRMLRDIGVRRGEIDRMAIRPLHDAMRSSGG